MLYITGTDLPMLKFSLTRTFVIWSASMAAKEMTAKIALLFIMAYQALSYKILLILEILPLPFILLPSCKIFKVFQPVVYAVKRSPYRIQLAGDDFKVF